MQARIRPALVALAFATATFAGTAGTALMATPITTEFCGGNNGLVLAEYVYDSSLTPAPITDLIAVNNDSVQHTISVTLFDRTTGAPVVTNTFVAAPNTSKDWNIAPANVTMVQLTGKGGALYWAPPYNTGCAIS